MHINPSYTMHFKVLNDTIRNADEENIVLDNCIGQRYIGSGLSDKTITINGIPGNALGAYLNGAHIVVHGNAQDATGDTMNEGSIHIYGSSGDATGYAMRGGKILVEKNAGYRAGIHMKAYQKKLPVLVIGGTAGSFLGEYQAGGIIIVLGLGSKANSPVGRFCGTGMHGGKIYLRSNEVPHDIPRQIVIKKCNENDLLIIKEYIKEYCEAFHVSQNRVLDHNFYVLSADTKNPYKQMYTYN